MGCLLMRCYQRVFFVFIVAIFGCSPLLISFSSYADTHSETKNKDFNSFIHAVEDMQDNSLSKALSLLNSYAESIETLPIKQQIKYYEVSSSLYSDISDYVKSKAFASKGLVIAEQLERPIILMSELYYIRGFALERLGDIKGATKEYVMGLEIAESLEEKKYVADGLTNLGAIYYINQQYDRSMIMLNDALTIANSLDDEELKGYINSELGILYSYVDQREKSAEFYQASYDHYKKAGKEVAALKSLRNIAVNHFDNSRFEEGIAVILNIIKGADKINNNEVLGDVYSLLANAHMRKEQPNPELAVHYIHLAEQYIVSSKNPASTLFFKLDKANLFNELERYDDALTTLSEVEEFLVNKHKVENAHSFYNLLFLQSEIYFKTKQYAKAYAKQTEFMELLYKNRSQVDVAAVEELRLRFESEHADLKKKILEQEQAVQAMQLSDVAYQESNRQLLIIFISLVFFTLAWFLIKLMQGKKHLIKVSHTDDLTGVINRRRIMEVGQQCFEKALEQNTAFCVLMIDIDDFKNINDSFGHKTGDQVLKAFAQIGHESMRSVDSFGRFGGEEFIVLLPETSKKHAHEVANRLKTSIAEYQWGHLKLPPITVSIGLASYQYQKTINFSALLKSADVLLYQAKHQGKNRVCAA
jgi:diguanylate cyclase (GGDEF)-like protein